MCLIRTKVDAVVIYTAVRVKRMMHANIYTPTKYFEEPEDEYVQ